MRRRVAPRLFRPLYIIEQPRLNWKFFLTRWRNVIGTSFRSTHVGCHRGGDDHHQQEQQQRGKDIDRHGRLASSAAFSTSSTFRQLFGGIGTPKILTVVVIANFSLCSVRHRHFNAGSPRCFVPSGFFLAPGK